MKTERGARSAEIETGLSREPFVWFSDSNNEVVGDRYCSHCRRLIDEDDVPLMIFRGDGPDCQVARFHSGVISLGR